MRKPLWIFAILALSWLPVVAVNAQTPAKNVPSQPAVQPVSRDDVGRLWAEINSLKEGIKTAASSRFQVVVLAPRPGAVQDHAVLIDSVTGQTWQLVEFQGEVVPVWMPVTRLDTRAQIDAWIESRKQK